MDLPTYIRSLGVDQAAEKLGVTKRRAMSWMYGTRRPRPQEAPEIIKRSDGQLSWDSIYNGAEHQVAQA